MKTSWMFAGLIPLVWCVAVASKTPECLGNECRTIFSCKDMQGCSCFDFGGSYELCCGSDKCLISLEIHPHRSVHFDCMKVTSSSDYDLLRGLSVGPVNFVDFHLCPLPETSLSQLLASYDVASVTRLRFVSRRNLTTFDKKHLTGLSNVTELIFTNNNVTWFSGDFLSEVPGLTWLDLKENNIEELEETLFRPVPKLEFLELGGNKLKQVKSPVWSTLKKLRILNLWGNVLMNLTRSAFSGLTGLEQLDLSSNLMNSLSNDLFRDLESLTKLNLSANNYTNIPEGVFSENSNLGIIKCHDNRQTLLLGNGAFANLGKLKEIYLMRNDIKFVPENLFWGSKAIESIHFGGNALDRLPPLLFRDQESLEILDLSRNDIENLPEYLFGNLHNLKTLDLSYNKIKIISRELFYATAKLVTLNMNNNELSFVDSESLTNMQNLKRANFSHNMLTFLPKQSELEHAFPYKDEFGSRSPFRNCVSLDTLDLFNNSVTEIFYDWTINLLKLRSLNLSYNRIDSLRNQDIHFLGGEILVDLRHNNISTITLEDLEEEAVLQTSQQEKTNQQEKVRILLGANPLNCNCHAYEFFRYLERKLKATVYQFVTLVPVDLKCNLPEELHDVPVEEVESSHLTCPLDHGNACPTGCSCSWRRHDRGLVVNCTNSGLTEIPGILPRVHVSNHTELLLDGNRIGRLPNSTYPGYENVTHLHLSSNHISNIGVGMLSQNLQVLTLDDNNLTALTGSIVKFLSGSHGIRILTLHNNPWKCDCSARELLDLIQQKFNEIPHLSNVTCSKGNEPLSKMSVSDLCPASEAVLVSCIAAGVFGILVGILAGLYYRYQREVRVWLYGHRLCLWFVTEEELDRDKKYDAFVSYSHKDEHFVVNTLVPELESGENPFKLCLHYRDWIAGEWIPNQIARSVENSRRTLVVLSPNFLESVWSRMEFRAAHKQALSEGRARVIVVLYGDVGPTEDLDPELRAYISMNTYVKWGDPWFWGKLKYALPHPPSLVNTNLNFMRRRTMRKEKINLDDKLELIHTLDPLCSPPGGTTPPTDTSPNGNVMPNKQSD